MPPSPDDSIPIGATTRLVSTGDRTLITDEPRFSSGELYVPGDRIDGKYTVKHVHGGLGKSGMGVVYIADFGHRTVALKSIQRRFAKDLGLVERFLRESRSWMLLGFQTHVVHAYRIDVIDATPFLFLEYIAPNDRGALSLADHLHAGALPLEEALRYGIQCAAGMRRATEALPDLVHRDLKPENLLITRNGVLKITDFGLVRTTMAPETPVGVDAAGGDDLTSISGGMLGTPAYMAPEQFEAAGGVGIAADIYAFGCCFYEAITGRRVFSVEGKTGFQAILAYRDLHRRKAPIPLREIAPEGPAALDSAIMRCLEKEPGDRWADWASLYAELLALYENHFGVCYLDVETPDPSPFEVAEQVQSLTLLDGYRRAVHLRRLREQHESSPYAFHLALASYFHCHNEPEEAQRQLERAVALKGSHDGYEAVGRLTEYCIEQGSIGDAEALLNGYLEQHPNGVERVLEAAVRLNIARKNYAGAIELLHPYENSWRGRSLLAEILKAAGRGDELRALLEQELSKTIETLRRSIEDVKGGAEPAWARAGDADRLCEAFAILDAETDTSAVRNATHYYWPQLDGYPDFAASMARLSWVLGELAPLNHGGTEAERDTYSALAAKLDHPGRMREYLERDERWLWEQ